MEELKNIADSDPLQTLQQGVEEFGIGNLDHKFLPMQKMKSVSLEGQ